MAIAENGEHRRFPDVVGAARGVIDWARKEPGYAIANGLVVSSVTGLAGLLIVNHVSGAGAERVATMEAAEQARLAALKADFQETGGINMVRDENSFRVTLRESARLAPQNAAEAILIKNAWSRITRETGCEPTQTVILPEVPDLKYGGILAPKMYLIGIKC